MFVHLTRHEVMKRSRIISLILLTTSAIGYWLVDDSTPAPMRMVVEGDVSDRAVIDRAKLTVRNECFLVRENYFTKMALADSTSAARAK